MIDLGGFAFAAPWMLAALVIVPLIWWLLRITPPTPARVLFPAVRLLFGLMRDEETPAKTPPWLIVLRMAIATLVILALAEPLLNPGVRLEGQGPLLIAVDDGWASARRWDRRQAALADLIDKAERADRPVVLLTTAPTAADGMTPPSGILRAAQARDIAQAMQPKPWPVDRDAARATLGRLLIGGGADVVWLSDGLEGGDTRFAAALAARGRLRVFVDADLGRTLVLASPGAEPGVMRLTVKRPVAAAADEVWLRASSESGAVLARQRVLFAAGEHDAEVVVEAPAELRNDIVRLDIEGARSAAGVVLIDERWRRRPVGLVSASSAEADQPLLSELYYLERALNPFSEVRKGELRELLARPLAVLVLADVAKVIGDDRSALVDWLEAGGVLIRFAGPRIADRTGDTDDLVPVRLRGGGRVLGGAMSWNEPAPLAPFAPGTPFAGLAVPADVRVHRQVLAEPALDLAAKTWARLADGTPLVTAERREHGWLVLVHTTANTAWSDLALSGLFVEMLQRLAALSQGVAGEAGQGFLAPITTLDGFGRLADPPPTARPIPTADIVTASAGPASPPGFYGADGARHALNLGAGMGALRAIGALPESAEKRVYGETGEIDIGAWLLVAVVVLALVDLIASLALRGLVRLGAAAATAGAVLVVLAAPPAYAQQDDDFVLKATLETRLAYVRTGDDGLDEISRAGLVGLGATLRARTSIEPAPPMGIDIDRDEIIFFPLIYWPMSATQPPLRPRALAKVDHYLKTGGIILFDTRDQNARLSGNIGGGGPGAKQLRKLLGGLNVPPLQPVPAEHVLTRAFYLMQDFPGRWTGGPLWVERHEGGVNDGVSSLIIGSHDWAAAWAIDQQRRPMFAVVPDGERQREQAYRFGINLVMYAMTGNYKADQVHLPAILERLGQ